MKVITQTLDSIGTAVLLVLRTLRYLPSLPRQRQRLGEQLLFMGNATLPLVLILSFCIGAVLALQVGYSFQNMGVNRYIGSVVGLALVRELGPVMTAIMVVGRIGSAITAELASMKIYREVDALQTMNIPPERFLVLPRITSIALIMPILTMGSFVAGWAGGAIVCEVVPFIDLDYRIYFRTLTEFVTTDALMDGLIKAEVFGLSVVIIASSIGLNTRGGPREIGQSVTRSVVASIIFVLFINYFITKALL